MVCTEHLERNGSSSSSVNYLLNPPASVHSARPGAAIAILVVYFILVLFMAITYFRVIFTIITNPGYVPRGAEYYRRKQGQNWRKGASARSQRSSEKTWTHEGSIGEIPHSGLPRGRPSPETESPGLENFWKKDCFVCEGDGRPVYCSMCSNWKPDRTHHCSEVDRCVRKMDHFCPW